jgi:hypothetical protein
MGKQDQQPGSVKTHKTLGFLGYWRACVFALCWNSNSRKIPEWPLGREDPDINQRFHKNQNPPVPKIRLVLIHTAEAPPPPLPSPKWFRSSLLISQFQSKLQVHLRASKVEEGPELVVINCL